MRTFPFKKKQQQLWNPWFLRGGIVHGGVGWPVIIVLDMVYYCWGSELKDMKTLMREMGDSPFFICVARQMSWNKSLRVKSETNILCLVYQQLPDDGRIGRKSKLLKNISWIIRSTSHFDGFPELEKFIAAIFCRVPKTVECQESVSTVNTFGIYASRKQDLSKDLPSGNLT